MTQPIDCGDTPSPPKINECPRGRSGIYRAHSKGEPDAPTRNHLNVRFAIASPVVVEIKPFIKPMAQNQLDDDTLAGFAPATESLIKSTGEPVHESL